MSPQEEFVVAEWVEAEAATSPIAAARSRQISIAAIIAAAVFAGIAIWQHSFSLGIAAFVALFIVVSLKRMPFRSGDPRTVRITNLHLQFGEQSMSLEEIAGFWLAKENEVLIITFEPKKASIIPITCLFANTDEDVARQMLSQVLAELEARPTHFTDSWSKYLG